MNFCLYQVVYHSDSWYRLYHLNKPLSLSLSLLSSWDNLRLLRDTWELSGSVSVCQGSVRAARGQFKAVRTIICQYDYAFMCLRTIFCLMNISAPWYRTELVLYSKFAYGSQF